MRRHFVAAPLVVLLLALTGCGGGDPNSSPGSAESNQGESPSAAPPRAVTASEFCRGAQAAIKAGAPQELAVVVADGLPDDMSADAVAGLQVLIDMAPQLRTAPSALSAYRGLSSAQRGDVTALAGYFTITCGKNLVAELIPTVKKLPSELLSRLPSELPSFSVGN